MALFFGLGACSLIDPHNMIGRHMVDAAGPPTEVVPSPRPSSLSEAEREAAFDFVWSTIHERYYDPTLHGIDWQAIGTRYRPLALQAKDDEAFWDALDRMTGELKDAHTRVESPTRVALRKRDEAITLGFSFLPLEGRLAVVSVSADSDAWWAGLRSGMSIVRINGEPAAAVYERLKSETRLDSTERSRHMRTVRRLLAGTPGTRIAFTFERADGTTFDASLVRRVIPTRATEIHRVLPSGYGYIRFTEWSITATARAIQAVEDLRNTPGLIIDLRNNPGGAAHAVNMMLERFFPQHAEFGHVITRTGKPVSLFFGTVEIIRLKRSVSGDSKAYANPVVILTNSQSASASELFAGSMQAAGRAAVVGQPSCGCLLGFLGYARIPGGGELAYSEVGFVLSNGKRIEGEGVMPDRPVPISLSDLRAGRDRTLEEAQALLATMKPGAG